MTVTLTPCGDRTIHSVTFGLHLGGNSANQTVLLADIVDFAEANPTLTPQRIHWVEGGATWAKRFRATAAHASLPVRTLCRIEAGDHKVLERA